MLTDPSLIAIWVVKSIWPASCAEWQSSLCRDSCKDGSSLTRWVLTGKIAEGYATTKLYRGMRDQITPLRRSYCRSVVVGCISFGIDTFHRQHWDGSSFYWTQERLQKFPAHQEHYSTRHHTPTHPHTLPPSDLQRTQRLLFSSSRPHT